MNTILHPQIEDSPRSRVVRSLKQWMDEGLLVAGQPLPSERTLSEQLQVDRGTVRRALSLLSDEGLLQSQNGRTRVVRRGENTGSGLLQDAVAVVCHAAKETWVGHRQSGWSDYITHGTAHAIRQHGMDVVTLRPEIFASRGLARMLAEKPQGVVLLDSIGGPEELLRWAEALRNGGVPVVLYGGGPEVAAFDRVVSDHLQGSYLAANWLARRGHRHIVQVWQGSPEVYWYPHRRLGYERALEEFGLPVKPTVFVPADRPALITEEYFHASAARIAEVLRPHLSGGEKPDALMVSSDGPFRYVAGACRLLGLEPNVDIVLTGYDNYFVESEEARFEPAVPMATVDKQNLKIGEELVRLLWERGEGRLPAEPQTRRVQPKLVVVGDGSEQF